MMPPLGPPHIPPAIDPEAEKLAGYLRSQFMDQALSDCTLELRYSDDNCPPLRMAAHRMVLGRSEALRQIMIADAASGSPGAMGLRTVLVQSDNKYLRSDSFSTAVQHLYGAPLFTIPEPPPESNGLQTAGSIIEKFNFVLGYAASGHVLQYDPLVIRGMELIGRSLTWDTLERALEFAIGDSDARGTVDLHRRFPCGDRVDILLNAIVAFLVNNFPVGFKLDTSVVDPPSYRRLPEVPDFPQTPQTPEDTRHTPQQKQTPIARGTNLNVKGRRPGLSHIKFGDLSPDSLSDSSDPRFSAGPNAYPAKRPSSSDVQALSRVLLNLPFSMLKETLESGGHGNVTGWANSDTRHQVIRDVVAEREARRHRARDAVKAGLVPNAHAIDHRLHSSQPQSDNEWDVLGWREEVVPFGNPDIPCLGRVWEMLPSALNGGALYP
jgi:hypothetical protein